MESPNGSGVGWFRVVVHVHQAPFFCGEGNFMAKTSAAEPIYKIVEVIGTSTKSWEDAAMNAVGAAAKSLRDLRIAEVVKMDMKVDKGKVVAYRTRVLLSFKYEN
jgi:flavin-binding protein dodecin